MDRSRQVDNTFTRNPPAMMLMDSRFVTVMDWRTMDRDSMAERRRTAREMGEMNSSSQWERKDDPRTRKWECRRRRMERIPNM